MSDLTITLEGSEVRADFFGTNAWLRNDGTSTIYAGRKPGVVSGADGVVSVPAGGSAPVFDAHGTIYIIGNGSVQLIGSDYSNNPFKTSAQGGSGADEVARAAIEAHAGNSAIHLTAEQINGVDGGKTVEKSASYTLDNAVDYPIVDMRMFGKSTQKRYSGKNLLNYDAWKAVSITGGTAVFENNGITLTATKDDCYTIYLAEYFPEAAKIPINEGETITLSWQETDNKEGMVIIFPNGSTETTGRVAINNKSGKTLSYTATAEISFVTFRFGVQNNGDTISYKNIQIEKGSTATAYEPYVGGVPSPNPDYPQDIVSVGDSGTVGVTACGKNLIPFPYEYDSRTINGLTFVVNSDGSIKVSGTCTANTYFNLCRAYFGDEVVGAITSGAQTKNGYTFSTRLGYTASTKALFLKFFQDETIDEIFYPQIEKGDTATAYEPYIGSTANITSALPLCGIPVDADGNYTDSNGQQWICDELIYNADGTGKIVKRTNEMTFDGSDDEPLRIVKTIVDSKHKLYIEFEQKIKPLYKSSFTDRSHSLVLCNKYETSSPYKTYNNQTSISINHHTTLCGLSIYDEAHSSDTLNEWKSYLASNPVTVVYPLNTPQELDLTAEEMTALKALQTFDGITNISNDSGAEMRVKYCTNRALSEYVKPIKTGLQKQIDELKTAVLSLGGNV